MKIAIIGTRGIPAKYGGFETFAQELSVRLVRCGIEVDVYCDNTDKKEERYNGVHLKYISCTKSENPLKYYRESIKKAEQSKCDIILSCGLGGAPFMFENFFGSKTIYITNTDGVEHKREKWSYPKRKFIQLCEYCSVKFSDYLIADSSGIKKYLEAKYSNISSKIFQIEYGAYIVDNFDETQIKDFGLSRGNYYLIVSRLEPENNVLTIIDGYLKSSTNKPLIIVGNLMNTPYVKLLLERQCDNVRFIGGIYDKSKLESIRQGCYAYLHGHSVGGTNPSLLEALGCGNLVIAHDNIYNREVTAGKMLYFKDILTCSSAISEAEKLNDLQISNYAKISRARIEGYYNWDRITDQYQNAFNNCIKK